MLLKINGNTINFTKDYTLLQICDSIGVRVPRFCYNDQMSIAGNCRMCLVEMKGGPKPLVSCTSRGIPNMEIYTESPLVKKAREGVVEFLLANHPLDCPICDQGGECDLQDQSEKFGGDSSRSFLFFKRPVQDKDMGLFIKTIMVRCIHCTRCIRFLKDKALTNDLGTIGRGEKTEISFYFNKFLDKSLLSGNIVDICPVGALTNKDYSFKGRPWEMDEIKFSGISDTLGLNMKLAIKRGTNKILRVTPSFCNETGTKLISDFSRHCVDGIILDRIETKSFKSNSLNNLFDLRLSSLFLKKNYSFKNSYKDILKNDFVSIIGPYTSFKDLLFLTFKINEKGSNYWYHSSFLKSGTLSIYPFLYTSNNISENFININDISNNSFFGIKKYSLKDLRNRYFSIGTDFLSEFPSLSSKILSGVSGYIVSRDSFFMGLLPYKKKNVFFNYKKGLSTSSLLDILEGRSKLCKNICKNMNSFIFFSIIVKKRFDGDFIQSFSNSLSFFKNSNGTLSSIGSESSSLDILIHKNAILNKLSNFSLYNLNFYSLSKINRIFNVKNLNIDLYNSIRNNILLCLGELSEKITSISFKTPLLTWIYLSNFSSRNLNLKKNKFNDRILGKLILPKIFFIEESYDFLTTLGNYKKIFWSPLFSNNSQLNLKGLLDINSNIDTSFKYFITNSNDNSIKSNLKSFPIYFNKNYVYLTEIKSLSKENLFQEDTFLKKSPRLLKLISFFRLSHSSFKN